METEPQSALPAALNGLSADQLSSAQQALFQSIQVEWDKAESVIKRSELTTLDQCTPAVAELRYAGRRIVDAFVKAGTPGDHNAAIQALLEDARFCCHRAQHDAIDVTIAKIAIDLDNLTTKLGFEPVLHAYPEFREFYAEFAVVRDKIVVSRANRHDRHVVYDLIANTDLNDLVRRYERIMAVRPLAKRTALKMRLGSINGYVITGATILGMLFAGLAVDWKKWLPSQKPVVTKAQPAASPSPGQTPSPKPGRT